MKFTGVVLGVLGQCQVHWGDAEVYLGDSVSKHCAVSRLLLSCLTVADFSDCC